jgi:hypothetical protein
LDLAVARVARILVERGAAMHRFVIVELDDGCEVVDLLPNQTPEDAAFAKQGFLVNEETYATYEEAQDAMAELDMEQDMEND